MKIVFICPDMDHLWESNEWRCYWPANIINQTRRHSATVVRCEDFISKTKTVVDMCNEADIILIHRNLWVEILPVIQFWRARDKIIIADFDEAYHLMKEEEIQKIAADEGYQNGKEKNDRNDSIPLLTRFKWCLQLVNAATVPHIQYSDDWKPYTRVEIIPDYINLDQYIDLDKNQHDNVVIGWRGEATTANCDNNQNVIEALREIIHLRPNVRLLTSTKIRSFLKEIPEQKILLFEDPEKKGWPKRMRDIDIGIIPRKENIDMRSSRRPLLEYMVTKTPWVASRCPSYYEFRTYGVQVENTAEDWYRALIDVVDHLDDYRIEAALEPYLYAIGQSLEENTNLIIDTYARIAGYKENL